MQKRVDKLTHFISVCVNYMIPFHNVIDQMVVDQIAIDKKIIRRSLVFLLIQDIYRIIALRIKPLSMFKGPNKLLKFS